MNDEAKKRLRQMTPEERKARFRRLRNKLGLADPIPINSGGTPLVTSLEEHEEYAFLKANLGYSS